MTQRLGIAAAMLGNPRVLMLDEPVNGLDPEGIRWVRNFVRYLAGEGRTILVSSHLMSEMAQTADHLIVIGRGTLIADCSTQDFIQRSSERSVLVRTPDHRLGDLITANGGVIKPEPDGALGVTGLEASQIGELAAGAGVILHELTPRLASLEEAFMELTADSVEFGRPAGGPDGAGGAFPGALADQPGQPDYSGRSTS
jgi:ABC-2 type transport system ATP-binding protein